MAIKVNGKEIFRQKVKLKAVNNNSSSSINSFGLLKIPYIIVVLGFLMFF